jgi:Zn-dependent protease with chaperone function
MSYLLRLTLLSSALFFLSYVFVSSALAVLWTLIRRKAIRWGDSALYGLRVAPLVAATAIVGLLVIPSFLYLEPLETGESLSVTALGFAFGGIVVLVAGTVSVLLACWRTARFVAACTTAGGVQKPRLDSAAIEISGPAPILAVAGAYQPKVLVSRELRRLLAPGEMQAAIQHELAHINRHDNLKKLVLRFARFPFLAGLELTWLNAAELAADDAAATSEAAAIDLASALLKVAGKSNVRLPDLAMSLAPEGDSALRVRVERLLSWKPGSGRQSSFSNLWKPAVLAVLLFAISYSPLLRHVHELTELFVR